MKKPLSMDEGHYMLVTGTRMANGSVLAEISFFNIEPGKTSNIKLEMRESQDDVQVIGNFNSENKFKRADNGEETSLLATTGRGYYIVAVLGARQEPTNHAMRDIAAVKKDLEEWGRGMVLLFPDEKGFQNFDPKEFGELPSTITYGIDIDKTIQKEIAAAMKLQNANTLPIFIIADTFNRVVIRQRIPHEGTTTFHDASFGDITVENKELEDQVLLKSDGLPTYNFANVVDDHLMGITHVVRGSEYLSSAPKYNLLYEAFGWEVPTYVHCSPVMRDAQHKMSKRNGDPSYEDLIHAGYLTEAVLNYVALLGWSPKGELAEQEFFTLPELVKAFDISGISKSPAVFDIEKLRWMNAEYMKKLTPEAFYEKAEPWLRKAVTDPSIDLRKVAALVQSRCEILSDLPERVDFLDKLPEYETELYVHKKSKTNLENSLETLNALVPVLEAQADWSNEGLYARLVALAEERGVKNSVILWPLRVALSGKASTPGGATELASLLGKEASIARVRKGIELLSK